MTDAVSNDRIKLDVPPEFTPDKYKVHMCRCGATRMVILRAKEPPHDIGCFVCQACGAVFARNANYGHTL